MKYNFVGMVRQQFINNQEGAEYIKAHIGILTLRFLQRQRIVVGARLFNAVSKSNEENKIFHLGI